jgi:hypothetical protein
VILLDEVTSLNKPPPLYTTMVQCQFEGTRQNHNVYEQNKNIEKPMFKSILVYHDAHIIVVEEVRVSRKITMSFDIIIEGSNLTSLVTVYE